MCRRAETPNKIIRKTVPVCGDRAVSPEGGSGVSGRFLGGLVAGLILVAGCGQPGGGGAAGQPAQGPAAGAQVAEERKVAVDMKLSEYAFAPRQVDLEPGELLDVTVRNDGTTAHEMVLVTPWADFEVELEPSTATGFGVKFREKGAFDYVCEIPGHRENGMAGRIVVGGVTPAAGAPAAEAEGEEKSEEVAVDLSDYRFSPDRIEVEAGTLLEFRVTNTAQQAHEMVIDAGGAEYEVEVGPGETRRFGLKMHKAGTYDYVCELPGHRENGMKGQIVVR